MVNMLNTWVEKIQSNDAHQVANLYHQNGILLGTFSNIERIGKDLIFDYFKDLLKSKVDVEIITQHESKTESISTVSGLYNFMVDGKKIEELTMANLEEQKKCLQILSERDYIKCINLNLDDENPYMEYETDDDMRTYDDINEITDEMV